MAYTVLPGLREMDFGDFEMRAYAGDLEHDPQFIVWCEDSEHNMCPNGERVRRRCWHEIWPRYSPLSTRGGCGVRDPRRVTSGLMMHWFGGTRYDYLLAPGEGYQVSFNEKNL